MNLHTKTRLDTCDLEKNKTSYILKRREQKLTSLTELSNLRGKLYFPLLKDAAAGKPGAHNINMYNQHAICSVLLSCIEEGKEECTKDGVSFFSSFP